MCIWLYSLVRKSKSIVAIVISVCIYNYIIIFNGNTDVWYQQIIFGQIALLRAIGGISLGIFTSCIYKNVNDYPFSVALLFLTRIIIITIAVSAVLYAVLGGHRKMDIFIVYLFAVFILCSSLSKNYINAGKILLFLESLAMPIYFFQQFVIDISKHIIKDDYFRIVCVLTIDILIAILYKYLWQKNKLQRILKGGK